MVRSSGSLHRAYTSKRALNKSKIEDSKEKVAQRQHAQTFIAAE